MTETGVLLVAAAALEDGHGRVLVQRRPPGKAMAGLWEFPGGKLEPGETPVAALVRELREELAITVDPRDLRPITFAEGPFGSGQLLLLFYATSRWTGELVPAAATALRWVHPAELAASPMPPADQPLVATLARRLADAGAG